MARQTTSKAKKTLMDLVKTTDDGETYKFTVDGDTNVARSFVHRMRVELSRLRNQVERDLNKRPSHFKLYLITLKEYTENELVRTEVELKRTKGRADISAEIEATLNRLVWTPPDSKESVQ